MRARRIEITDTTLRDAPQSLWATRMRIGHIVPILKSMDSVGFHSLESWGGATFDTCLRFLDENPWERLRTIKHHCRRTPLQMLLRGQNLVGYRHYGDEIVRAFVRHAAESGVDIFRVFDALNDVRNLQTAAEAIKESGAHFQGAVVYTISPVHTLDHYVEVAQDLVEMGADSICIKDMAALLSPYFAERLISRLKREIPVPLQLHCHYIGGLAPMTYLKAIEAGVDVVDTATGPLAFGASQPATEMLVTALKGTPYDTELDLDSLFAIADYWEKVREEGGFERGVTSLTHMRVYSHQVPGGMISNLISQLKEQKAEDRLQEVLEEIPRVREEVGYPPLVTPMSQIVGTQAVLNVLIGKRWQVVPDEMKAYLRGRYGLAPGPISPDIMRRVLGTEQPISGRPADLIEETLDQYREEIGPLARSEEDVLSYALFPNTARNFFERRHSGAEEDVFLTGEAESAEPEVAADRRCVRGHGSREGADSRRRGSRHRRGHGRGRGRSHHHSQGGYRPPAEGQAGCRTADPGREHRVAECSRRAGGPRPDPRGLLQGRGAHGGHVLCLSISHEPGVRDSVGSTWTRATCSASSRR